MDENWHVTEMRGFIMLAEGLSMSETTEENEDVAEDLHEEAVGHHPVIVDLEQMAFKLRAHTENDDGEYALGVEMGMQRAADMIDNLIRRHKEGN